MTAERADIATRTDIQRLVNTFYDRVRADGLLGPIFDDVAHVNWAEHLPRMYDFWEAVLFGKAGFKGNPLGVHLALARKTELTGREFDHWVTLFCGTVDELFSGPVADEAMLRAARIAVTMTHHIALQSAGVGFRS